MKVYGCAISTSTQRILACLYEKQLDFEFVAVDIEVAGPASNNNDTFLSLKAMNVSKISNPSTPMAVQFVNPQPFRCLPILQDDDINMFGSRAISNYLFNCYGNRMDVEIKKKKMATELTWLEMESKSFDPPASSLIFHTFYKPMLRMIVPNKSVVLGLESSLSKVLDVYDAQLAHCTYLTGDEFSLVDINHLPILHLIMACNAKNLVQCRPNVFRWALLILARPCWVKVLEAIDNGITHNYSFLLSIFNQN